MKNIKYKTYDYIKKTYQGGRTEVFKHFGANLYYYDVNSLYPYVMSKYKYPNLDSEYHSTQKITQNGFYRAKVTASDTYIPYLY